MAKRITQQMVRERVQRLIDADKLDNCTFRLERNWDTRYCALRFYGEDNRGEVKFDTLAECWTWLDYFDKRDATGADTGTL